MTDNTPKIQELEKLIIKHRFLYYCGNPMISDKEYDSYENELKKLDPDNKLFSEIGFDINNSSFAKIKHKEKMMSLGKVYTISEYNNWFPNHVQDVVVSQKIDGFAITLKYTLNEITATYILTQGVTRGDGSVGEDITENVKMISDIPFSLKIPPCTAQKEIEIRGEIYMKKSIFQKNKELAFKEEKKEYKTPRNLASGSTRNKDPKITQKRQLNFFAYDAIGIHGKNFEDILKQIEKIGIPVTPYYVCTLKQVWKQHESFNDIRQTLNYDIDGTVVRINDKTIFKSLGETSHHPRGAVAIKFEVETAESILKEVKWETSRTGLINPIAVIEPVEIGGAVITFATLHNISYIKKLDLKINCNIMVSRQGDVIPKILKKIDDGKNSMPIPIPVTCPSCNAPSKQYLSSGDVEMLSCTNTDCIAKKQAEIEHFVDVMGMKGLAGETISKLLSRGLIKNFVDLFKLDVSRIMLLEGFKKRSSEKVFNAIQFNRKKNMSVVLASLGIPTLGKSISKRIEANFDNINKLYENNIFDKLCEIEGISDKIATFIIQGLKEKQPLIEELLTYVEIIDKTKPSDDTKLSGKLFCISGSMTNGKKSIQQIIEKYGGEVKSSVVKDLDYLIAGEGSGNKSRKAEEYNIPIITEEEFFQMIGEEQQLPDNKESDVEEEVSNIMDFI